MGIRGLRKSFWKCLRLHGDSDLLEKDKGRKKPI